MATSPKMTEVSVAAPTTLLPSINSAEIGDVYNRAAARLAKCETFTAKLLAAEMSEETDSQLRTVISNCSTAIKEIQAERMTYTKVFDEIKKQFTTIEGGISAAAASMQKKRDQYATEKALARKKAEMEAQNKIARDHELIELRRECEVQLSGHVQNLMQTLSNLFAKGFKSVTEENYNEKIAKIKAYPETLPREYRDFKFASFSRFGHELEPIAAEVIDRNVSKYSGVWASFIHELRTESLSHLNNRKSAGFAVSKEITLDVSTTVDTKQIAIQADVEKTMATFAAAPEINEEKQARESVKLIVTDKLGYQAVAAFWFSSFLGSVDIDGLERKTLKSMVMDVEKLAKSTGEQIESQYLVYEVIYKAVNKK